MENVLAIGLGILVLGAYFAYTIVAFVQVQRDQELDRLSYLLWSIGILVLPIIASTAWFLLKPRKLVSLAALRKGTD